MIDLPRGPLTQHLEVMHNIVTTIAQWNPAVTTEFVLAHLEHCRILAAATHERPQDSLATRPSGFQGPGTTLVEALEILITEYVTVRRLTTVPVARLRSLLREYEA